jgi:hypothetical protein
MDLLHLILQIESDALNIGAGSTSENEEKEY